ncbi:hypothetical protein Tco_1398661, partial [Tanacetum coccineum]
IPRDILVVNAKQLVTKVKKNAADIYELVELKSLAQSKPAEEVSAATQGEQQTNDSTTETATAEEVPANAQGEQMSSALVVHSSVDEPPVKKLKVVLEDIPIPSPTPVNSVRPNIINNIPYDQYTANLFISGSFDFSLTLPPKVADKGNDIAQTFEDDQLKQLLPFMDEGGSVPKLPNLQQFSTSGEGQMTLEDANSVLLPFMDEGGSVPKLPNLQQFSTSGEGQMTLEDAKAQMEEIKRLADLKAKKEKYEKKLKRVLIAQELKARAVELAAYKAKRAKMMEYTHCINFRDDPLPITKFSYRANNSTKEATMRIVRNNQPLNLMVYEKFVLKKLGFTKWLELHALASRTQTKSNDQLLNNFKAKF